MYFILKQNATSRNAYWQRFLSIVKNYPKTGLFLEIGAATFEQVEAHKEMFNKIVGLDFEFEKLARSTGINLVNADAQFLPFKNNIFDGIISHHVIEHIEDDALFIKEAKRTLKAGGFAILGTPNRKRLVRVLIEIFAEKRKFPWRGHKREYTKEELLNLAKNANFKSFRVYCEFLGIHSARIICGFSHFPHMFEKWCNFLFYELIK